MNKEQILEWLRRNKDFVKITPIGKAAGVSNLRNIVDDRPDGRGFKPRLADKHVNTLSDIINEIKK